jgi:hypothetical protein
MSALLRVFSSAVAHDSVTILILLILISSQSRSEGLIEKSLLGSGLTNELEHLPSLATIEKTHHQADTSPTALNPAKPEIQPSKERYS